jgi:hypothetical protein
MSKMLRKKLISAELMVASSLLLVPGFTLTGYGQNTPQSSPPSSPSARLLCSCVFRARFKYAPC